MTVLAFILTVAAILPLAAILLKILQSGFGNLSWEAVSSLPNYNELLLDEDIPGEGNGFRQAIVGTLAMVGAASLVSIPFGVLTGVFLSEFTVGSLRASFAAPFVRFLIKILSSVPTVIIGIFAYVLLVIPFSFSAIAGAFALAVVMIPIVTLTTEESLRLVPNSYRLGSAALGGGRFNTIFRIIIPAALPAITTGILLAVARAAGETAPLMFTALFNDFEWQGWDQPTASLTVLIYQYASSPYPQQQKFAWTAALILVALVFATNVISRLVTRRQRL
ncbi:MAG: phosphate ABC transporter permease PstA [Cyanobacteria bacterium P01_H01_bin.15]